ncbi:MAG: peptide deformylase [Nanoarchaeota archaeon]
MIRPIFLYDDEHLRIASSNVSKGSKINIEALVLDMFETMHAAKGIGLSAIQIGVPLRIFVIEVNSKEPKIQFKGVYINPKITDKSDKEIAMTEGCLSIPGISAQKYRSEWIELEWYDEKWQPHKKKISGIEARVIQHEYEHLNGSLFIDDLGEMWNSLLAEPLNTIKDRKIEVAYLTK